MKKACQKFLLACFAAVVLIGGVPCHEAFAADCANAMTQAAVNECEEKSEEIADKNLNAVYKKLMAGLEKPDADKLRAAERAWAAYRDSQCEFNERESADGSMHPAAVSDCYQDFAAKRAKELQAQLNCEDNRGPCN